jgi:hypothetical protein
MIDNKIKPIHTQRSAFVDIRQSTPTQVEHHRESTARQYALVQRARDRGWPKEQVIVVDEDLGVSGARVVNRGGFTRMASEVALGRVGIILGLEVPGSRTLHLHREEHGRSHRGGRRPMVGNAQAGKISETSSAEAQASLMTGPAEDWARYDIFEPILINSLCECAVSFYLLFFPLHSPGVRRHLRKIGSSQF